MQRKYGRGPIHMISLVGDGLLMGIEVRDEEWGEIPSQIRDLIVAYT